MSIRQLELSKVKPVMYHVTRKTTLPSILKKGLLPARSPTGFSTDMSNWIKNSIYFSSSPKAAKEWVMMLSTESHGKVTKQNVADFVVLKVDVSPWVHLLKVDPDFEAEDGVDAYYLKGVTIPPENILKVMKITEKTQDLLEKVGSYSLWTFLDATPAKLKAMIPSLLPKIRSRLQRDIAQQLKIAQSVYDKAERKEYPFNRPGDLPDAKRKLDQLLRLKQVEESV